LRSSTSNYTGERVKECDFGDELQAVFDVAKKYPDAEITTIDVDGLSFVDWDVTYTIIYRKLYGVKRVTTNDLKRAIRAVVDEDSEEYKASVV